MYTEKYILCIPKNTFYVYRKIHKMYIEKYIKIE